MENFDKKREQIPNIDVPKYEQGGVEKGSQLQPEPRPDIKETIADQQKIVNQDLGDVFENIEQPKKPRDKIREIFSSKKESPFKIEELRNKLKE